MAADALYYADNMDTW